MTENELLLGLRKDFAEVRRDVTSLGREVSGMSQKLDSVCTSVKEHGDAIRALEIADATGSVSTKEQRADRPSVSSRAVTLLPLAAKALPWIVATLIGIGAYLGSGGDTEAMANALRAVNETQSILSEKVETLERQGNE